MGISRHTLSKYVKVDGTWRYYIDAAEKM